MAGGGRGTGPSHVDWEESVRVSEWWRVVSWAHTDLRLTDNSRALRAASQRHGYYWLGKIAKDPAENIGRVVSVWISVPSTF